MKLYTQCNLTWSRNSGGQVFLKDSQGNVWPYIPGWHSTIVLVEETEPAAELDWSKEAMIARRNEGERLAYIDLHGVRSLDYDDYDPYDDYSDREENYED